MNDEELPRRTHQITFTDDSGDINISQDQKIKIGPGENQISAGPIVPVSPNTSQLSMQLIKALIIALGIIATVVGVFVRFF